MPLYAPNGFAPLARHRGESRLDWLRRRRDTADDEAARDRPHLSVEARAWLAAWELRWALDAIERQDAA